MFIPLNENNNNKNELIGSTLCYIVRMCITGEIMLWNKCIIKGNYYLCQGAGEQVTAKNQKLAVS